MIRLFISDIDGCLTLPYQAFKLEPLSELARLAGVAGRPGSHRLLPALSVCSGRAYPYVEAISQLLGLQVPVLFEAGAGMFDPVTARRSWHPDLDSETRTALKQILVFIEELIDGTPLTIDHAKQTQVAVVGTDASKLAWATRKIDKFVRSEYPNFRTYDTPISIDIVASHLTKPFGLKWLAETINLDLSEMAYIGDTGGDIEALAIVGRSYATANANDDVKSVVDVTTEAEDTEGVVSAYWDAVRMNEGESKRP